MCAVLRRGALVGLVLAACARPIGVLTPRELLAAGRPREALAALTVDNPVLRALHEGTLAHAGGDWARSEAAFDRAASAALLPAEQEMLARLRATNALALRQDPAPLAAALPGFAPVPPEVGKGALVVVFERGAAPFVRVTINPQTGGRGVEVAKATPARVEVDDAPAVAAAPVDSLAQQWSAQLGARAGARSQLNPFAQFARLDEWWTPPTDWLVAQQAVPAGKRVVTVSTIAGRRAQVVDVAEGRTTFVVVPQ